MTHQPRIGVWFAATFAIFFTRAFLFSTWVSRGPEVKDLLHLNTVHMGIFTMLYPLGGLLGVVFSSTLVHRFGSRMVNSANYLLSLLAMVALPLTLTSGNVMLSAALLLLIGLPMAIADYVGNYEGTRLDQVLKRSVLSVIHGAFGIGMLLGAGLSSFALGAGVSIATHFILIACICGGAGIWSSLVLPKHEAEHITPETKKETRRHALQVWTEPRSLIIALVGFSFIMAETSAGTWVPIALTNTGFSEASAAFAFSFFWVMTTLMRLLGGYIVDAIGRWYTVLFSALTAAAGIALFMLVDVISLPYLALALWGAGMALGFPMSVLSMGDDAEKAPARINMIITIVYLAGMTVGPALGYVGQKAGIYTAFVIPLVILLISAALSKVTKPEQPFQTK